MVLIALAIRLDSDGPAIFRQKRVGLHGEIFTLFKFRTMRNGVDQDDDHRPAEKADSRFTRLGKLLRRTRLDELPQLVNILRGDMHFVGPRPFVPSQEQGVRREDSLLSSAVGRQTGCDGMGSGQSRLQCHH